MPIIVRLDRVMADRKISLTELASRVDLTIANLLYQTLERQEPSDFPPSKLYAGSCRVNPSLSIAPSAGDTASIESWMSRTRRRLP